MNEIGLGTLISGIILIMIVPGLMFAGHLGVVIMSMIKSEEWVNKHIIKTLISGYLMCILLTGIAYLILTVGRYLNQFRVPL